MAQEIKIKKLAALWETCLDAEMPESGGKSPLEVQVLRGDHFILSAFTLAYQS